MNTVNIHNAKTNLSKLIEAAERGEETTIARNGKPVARIVPIAPPIAVDPERDTPGKRLQGALKGKIKFLDPNWENNDEEFIDLFYDTSKFEKNPDAA